MPDLKDQIRAYYEATTEPVDVDTITVEPGTLLVGPFPDASAKRSIVRANTERRISIRGPIRAVAALVAIVVLSVIGFALTQRAAQDTVSTTDEAEAAFGAVDRFYAAIAEGDPVAIRDLLDPAFSIVLPGRTMDANDFVAYSAWHAIAGTEFDGRLCTPDGGEENGTGLETKEPSATTIVCNHEQQPYLHRKVNAEANPTTDTLIVSAEGRVISADRSFNLARLATVSTRFETWVSITYPGELERVLSGNAGSRPPPWQDGPAAAAENALVHVRYADEWAAYLEANGCTWEQPCAP